MENKIKSLLCNLGISDEESIVPFYSKVRDRSDVSVLKCNKSGVILLSRTDHIGISYYEEKQDFTYWGAQNRKTANLKNYEDTQRRFEKFKCLIANKKWVDVGTGAGGILDMLGPAAAETLAVEPQKSARSALTSDGYKVFSSIDEITSNEIEVATLFHVFEHLVDPVETMKLLRSKMKRGAKVIIEVPHAKDFLISFLDLDAFKSFTFWSEHYILHTRDSINKFLEAAGFSNIVVRGFQRYPLANHLHWLYKGKPSGHIEWDCLRTQSLDTAYEDMLSQLDLNDTIIAVATNKY